MKYNIVLINNQTSGFVEIIAALALVFQFPVLQAEQVATIAHYKGSAIIKEQLEQDVAMQYSELIQSMKLPITVEPVIMPA